MDDVAERRSDVCRVCPGEFDEDAAIVGGEINIAGETIRDRRLEMLDHIFQGLYPCAPLASIPHEPVVCHLVGDSQRVAETTLVHTQICVCRTGLHSPV